MSSIFVYSYVFYKPQNPLEISLKGTGIEGEKEKWNRKTPSEKLDKSVHKELVKQARILQVKLLHDFNQTRIDKSKYNQKILNDTLRLTKLEQVIKPENITSNFTIPLQDIDSSIEIAELIMKNIDLSYIFVRTPTELEDLLIDNEQYNFSIQDCYKELVEELLIEVN